MDSAPIIPWFDEVILSAYTQLKKLPKRIHGGTFVSFVPRLWAVGHGFKGLVAETAFCVFLHRPFEMLQAVRRGPAARTRPRFCHTTAPVELPRASIRAPERTREAVSATNPHILCTSTLEAASPARLKVRARGRCPQNWCAVSGLQRLSLHLAPPQVFISCSSAVVRYDPGSVFS